MQSYREGEGLLAHILHIESGGQVAIVRHSHHVRGFEGVLPSLLAIAD